MLNLKIVIFRIKYNKARLWVVRIIWFLHLSYILLLCIARPCNFAIIFSITNQFSCSTIYIYWEQLLRYLIVTVLKGYCTWQTPFWRWGESWSGGRRWGDTPPRTDQLTNIYKAVKVKPREKVKRREFRTFGGIEKFQDTKVTAKYIHQEYHTNNLPHLQSVS